MIHDLVIKNGTVVDGSGLPRYRTDVGVKDGVIAEMGRIASGGARVIDAGGAVVAPGFIDIHTHYDAQIMWDPLLTCSPWHGATTVMMTNCGYALAPCRPRDRDYMTRLFARVEGVDLPALEIGLPWDWQTFPEYLDRVASRPCGVNVGTHAGHSAMRRWVMGEEANRRKATPDEIAQMKQLVREAMEAGAFGFTTSLAPAHVGGDGHPVPSRAASHDEVIELSATLSEFGIGCSELIFDVEEFSEAHQNLMTQMSLRSGRPVTWNELSYSGQYPSAYRRSIEYMQRVSEEGARVYGISRVQRLDLRFTLQGYRSFDRFPEWKSFLLETPSKKLELLKDAAVRQKLKEVAEAGNARVPRWAKTSNVMFLASKTGKYRAYEGLTLGQIAEKTGKEPMDILMEWSAEEKLEAEFAFEGLRNDDLKAVSELLRAPHSLAGISDAGAHTDRMSGAYFPTHLLSQSVRDQGMLPLEDAVRRLTFMPASLYGLHDRGLVREGMKADIVIFDYDRLKVLPPERVADFPGGRSRLVVRSEGYGYLIVNGRVVFEGERPTGELPGTLLKSTDYTRRGITVGAGAGR